MAAFGAAIGGGAKVVAAVGAQMLAQPLAGNPPEFAERQRPEREEGQYQEPGREGDEAMMLDEGCEG